MQIDERWNGEMWCGGRELLAAGEKYTGGEVPDQALSAEGPGQYQAPLGVKTSGHQDGEKVGWAAF